MSRIMIAGTGSGCGKTTIVCGLCQCIKDLGLTPSALKCGPDYIDARFHSRVLKMRTGNLDSWFCDKATIRTLLAKKENASDIAVIEGVMGYYDGAGYTTKGSSYEIARITDTPVILIVNCRGISNSVGAVLKGFTTFQENSQIRGVIFNQMSEKLYPQAKKAAQELGLIPLGFLPYKKGGALESRHLGLVTADEVVHFKEKIDTIAAQIKKSLDLEGILALAETAVPLKENEDIREAEEKEKEPVTALDKPESTGLQDTAGNKLRIAVAKDAAFCFLYEDNLEYLRANGCELVFFSPLSDKKLPEKIDGLLLYGGYPELHTKALSENETLKSEIKEQILGGLPCIAECGGFLYLHETLETPEKERFPMCGVIAGNGFGTGKLCRFGYMTLTAQKDTMLAAKGETIRAHEFHYWNSDNIGADYEITKASDNTAASGGYGTDTLYAGFPHIYFYGNEAAAKRFLKACEMYHENNIKDVHVISYGMEEKNDIYRIFPELAEAGGLDKNVVKQAQKHWNSIAKPLYGLGKMEQLITQIAGIQNTPNVAIDKRAVIVMCADNGIVEEGVTQTGQEVTAVVSCNMADGISSVCKMADYAYAEVIPVNIGIAADCLPDGTDVNSYPGLLNRRIMAGTKNFLKEPAMSEEQLTQAVYTGMNVVKSCKEQGYQLLATGEMGIGNTTTSTALACILLDLKPQEVTGRGAGLDNAGLKRKTEVIAEAQHLYTKYKKNPLCLLQKIGGLDIAGLVGVFLGGTVYRIPVIVDGVISAVAALIAVSVFPAARDFIIASHQGKEPAMKALLKALEKEAVLFAELALGEGTGAVMLFPLLDMAMRVYRENTTFEDIQIEAYEDYKKC